MTDLDKFIKEIEDLCNKATPGPWHDLYGNILKAESALSPKYHVPKDWNIARYPHHSPDYPISPLEYNANRELISKSREIIPRLLKMIKIYREALENIAFVSDMKPTAENFIATANEALSYTGLKND